MDQQEFLRLCREVMETYRKGHDLCLEIQSSLNDDYRNGLDFGLYIETVLRRLLDGDTDIHAMMPNVITLPDRSQNTSAA